MIVAFVSLNPFAIQYYLPTHLLQPVKMFLSDALQSDCQPSDRSFSSVGHSSSTSLYYGTNGTHHRPTIENLSLNILFVGLSIAKY